MNKSRFKIVGITPPGKIDIFGFGVVNLYECDDDKLEKILKATDLPYIYPAVEVPKPVKEIYIKQKVSKKTSTKKSE